MQRYCTTSPSSNNSNRHEPVTGGQSKRHGQHSPPLSSRSQRQPKPAKRQALRRMDLSPSHMQPPTTAAAPTAAVSTTPTSRSESNDLASFFHTDAKVDSGMATSDRRVQPCLPRLQRMRWTPCGTTRRVWRQ